MEEMGKQMIKHCRGLPLAIKVLGGLLATRYTLDEWKRVCENIGSHILGGSSFSDRNISSVYHILYMSFEELPIYLKHCFLYPAHFPENYPINVEALSYLWASEGIPRLRYYQGATTREVAHGYIEELVKRNMVISERDELTSRYETCRLHDMMREVCLLKIEEENFLQIVHSTSVENTKYLCKSRRLAIDMSDKTYHTMGEMKNLKLRSLLLIMRPKCSGLFFARLWLTLVQLMRVLDLSYAHLEGKKLPSSIGKLIHLRYLNLYMTYVTHLPSSMQNLKKLLYLNLYVVDSGYPIYIPNIMKEMQDLVYLCLPPNIHNRVKMELGNLMNLETLENFSTKNSNVRDLHRMTRLEKLLIIYNGGCLMETLSSSLSELRHLEYLSMTDNMVHAPTNDEKGFVLDCIHRKQLILKINMPKLPDAQHFPSCLTTIDLNGCHLKEDPMPILEKLLQLKEVNLRIGSFCGRRMVCSSSGFPQLQKLYLFALNEWEEWVVEKGSMALLHTLTTIRHCQKLKEVPNGLRFITSLKKLNIYTHFDINQPWKEKLSEGGEDYYKVQHIPFVHIH